VLLHRWLFGHFNKRLEHPFRSREEVVRHGASRLLFGTGGGQVFGPTLPPRVRRRSRMKRRRLGVAQNVRFGSLATPRTAFRGLRIRLALAQGQVVEGSALTRRPA
jgi:hypothetical protein